MNRSAAVIVEPDKAGLANGSHLSVPKGDA
jgi:hypothetical protein